MKRWLAAIALAACCMLTLAGCNGVQEPGDGVGGGPTETPDEAIHITVGEVTQGATVSSVPVEVTVYGEPVESRTEWVVYTTDSYAYLKPTDTFPANFWGRLDVYYNLPEGSLIDNMEATIDAPGGTYDGTGDYGTADSGQTIAWSHIQYGSEPEAETEAEQPDTSGHKHSWTVDNSQSQAAGCTYDGYKTMSCKGCGETYKETIPAKGHAYSSTIVKPATCAEGGVERFSCANCGTVYEEYIYEKPHSWSGYTSYSETNNWRHERHCTSCGTTETNRCTFSGASCTVCGQVVVN